MQAYELSRLILERGAGFAFGNEDYMWFNVHILARARTIWAENGKHRWNELAEEITKEAHKQGLIKSSEAKVLENT